MNDFDTQSVFGLDTIVKNLLCDGGNEWTYRIGENQMVEIIPRDSTTAFTRSKESKINSFLKDLDIAIELFIELLSDLDDDFVHMEFICIFKRWLFSPEKISNVIGEKDGINPFFMLIDLRLLESIGDKFKDNLGRSPLEMLEIVDNFLDAPSDVKMENADEVDSDDEDDAVEDNVSESTLPILLQLLSAILSESSTADLNEACFNLLKEIKRKLLSISSKQPSDIATPAKALHDRIVELLEGDKFPLKQSMNKM